MPKLLISDYSLHLLLLLLLTHLSTKHSYIFNTVQCSMYIKNCNKIMFPHLLFTNNNNHMVKVKADCNENSL